MNIRIFLVDDHVVMREGLRALIDREKDLVVIGEAGNGREALAKIEKTPRPDIVIMDIGMGELNGIEATRRIRTRHPAVKVLILSVYTEREFITRAFAAGANGYLPKECAARELVHAIYVIHDGKSYISPSISNVMLDDFVKRRPHLPLGKSFSPLSDREREVLQPLVEGRSVKEIAGALHVSVKTVQTHRANLMAKLKVTNLADLVRYAIRKKISFLHP